LNARLPNLAAGLHLLDLPAEPCDTDLAADIPEPTANPVARLACALISLPGGTGQ
jgi:hypothetical protein